MISALGRSELQGHLWICREFKARNLQTLFLSKWMSVEECKLINFINSHSANDVSWVPFLAIRVTTLKGNILT